ncbi:MAG TPA: MFS transporter [Allosphingosinicella sp.]|nr:MFS transporter [Allosphingosinicella sp.]
MDDDPDRTSARGDAAGSSWRELFGGGRGPVLALILLGDWLVAADALVTATIMPGVGASLSAFAWFGWAAAAFLTGLVVAGASAGWLAERLGLRAALILGGAFFALGCVLSAAAPGIAVFMLGRILQGCAAGWVIGLIYVALAMLFPPSQLPRVFALATSVWGIATLAGPLLGGLFADAGLWRGVFWLFAAQAVLFTAAVARLIPPSVCRTGSNRFAVRPLILLGAGIAAMASAGVVEGVAPAVALGGGGVGLLLLAFADDRARASGVLPRRAASPGLPIGAAYLAYFATTAAGVAFALYGPAVLQFRHGLSALEAGYVAAAEALAWTAAGLAVAGAGAAWRGRLIVAGAASILAGVTALALVMNGASLAAVAGAGAVLGAGYGLSYGFISRRVMAGFDEADRARGSSAIGVVRNAGGAVGAALAGLAANAAGFGGGLDEANVAAVAWAAFGVGIPFALIGLAAALRLTRRRSPLGPLQAGRAPGITEAA